MERFSAFDVIPIRQLADDSRYPLVQIHPPTGGWIAAVPDGRIVVACLSTN